MNWLSKILASQGARDKDFLDALARAVVQHQAAVAQKAAAARDVCDTNVTDVVTDVTDDVTDVVTDVTENVTPNVTESETNAVTSVTDSVTDSVTNVTDSVTDSATSVAQENKAPLSSAMRLGAAPPVADAFVTAARAAAGLES